MTAADLADSYLATAERAIASIVYDKIADGTPIDGLDGMQARAVLRAAVKELAMAHLALTLASTDVVTISMRVSKGYARPAGDPSKPAQPNDRPAL